MKTGQRGRAARVIAWLAAAILCVPVDHAAAQGSVAADREGLVILSTTQPTGSIPSSSINPDTSSAIFVPVLLTASGRSNSLFTSELTLTNPGTEEVTLHYTYTAHRGGGSGTATDRLAPGRQRIQADAIAYLTHLGIPIPGSGNRIGTLRVEVSGSSGVGVSVRTTTLVADGRAGLAYPGIATAAGFEETIYLCGLRQNRQDRSNVAVQNMGTSEQGNVTLRTTVYSGGAENDSPHVLPDVILPPGGFHQYNGILDLAGFDNGYVTVERVEGTSPFYAYGVINDNFNSDGSFVFPLTAGSLMGTTGQTLPVIVETGEFASELTVTNFSEEAKTLRFSFVADGLGTPDRTARFSLEIGAGRQRILPDVIHTQLRQKGAEGVSGSRGGLAGALFARAESGDMSGIAIGARTSASDGRSGHYGVFYHAAPYGSSFNDDAWVNALQQDGENRSNLALVNTGEVDGSRSVFEIDIYDGKSGALVNTLRRTVQAKRWHQIGSLLRNHARGATQGYVRIRHISGNNPYLAYGVINDGGGPGHRSGDGAYLPATTDGVTDREVLEAFYHATGGPFWNIRTNWLSDAPLSDWYSVRTDESGRVTSLILIGNGLSGAIPPELGQLGRLQRLYLFNNELSGGIPAELVGLNNLRELDLSYNALTGRIPGELGSLTHLQRLYLIGNELSGEIPVELVGLNNLRELHLGLNRLSGAIPPELGQLGHLRKLTLGGNELSGGIPVELVGLNNLRELDLSGNPLSGGIPPELGGLTKLSWLAIVGSQLRGGIPPELGQLTQLQALYLWDNPLSGAIPKSLQQLSELTSFDIQGTNLCVPTDAAFQAWLDTMSYFGSPGLVCDGTRGVFFSAETYEVTEGKTVTVSVRLIDQTGDPVRAVEIPLTATQGSGATAADYSGVPEHITIMAPLNEASFVVEAAKDNQVEQGETVVLGFRQPLPSGLIAGSPETATVRIHDPRTEELTNREVLETFYHATGGSDWINRTHWLSDAPLSGWFGVSADENGRVTSLDLFFNGLSGEIPPELGQMTQLQALYLGDNELSGEIPPELGGLTQLQTLYLGGNELSGTIPPELAGLTQLQTLYLGGNGLSGVIPPELGGLTQLQWLDLGVNRLRGGIPPELAGLTQLQHLNLAGNELSGAIPPELAGLTQLQWLDLGVNRLSRSIPPELGGLTQLQWLDLGANRLRGAIPPELAGLTQLQYLFLSGNELSGTIPPELAGLTRLQWLNLSRNRLSRSIPPELGGLTQLQYLFLSGNELNGTIPPELGGLTRLQWVNLWGNELSGEIPPELAGLTQLEHLNLGGNELSGAIPPELAGLTNLRSLAIWGNELSGTIPPELAELTNLEALRLNGNELIGEFPPELTQLANLHELDLSFNPDLTGTIPSGLQQLPLSTLDLMATSVCVPEDAELQEWLATFEFVTSGLTCGRSPDAMSSIDILVVYTPAARRSLGGTAEIEAKIDLMIAETNQSYLVSGVNQRLVLVAREEVEYTEDGDGIRALRRLRNASDGYMDEIHAIRDRNGADLVHLIGEVLPAGVAQLGGPFSVTCDWCPSFVFAHELGHNMGLHHDRYLRRHSTTFPFSHGYVNQEIFAHGAPGSAGWMTIMAYPDQCEHLDYFCDWILRFSNPNQTYLGDPLGVPGEERTTAVDGPADAVRTLNITRHSVAGFRPRADGNKMTMASTLSPDRSRGRRSGAMAPAPGGDLFTATPPNRRAVALRQVSSALDRATLRRREVGIDFRRLARVVEGEQRALRLNLFDDMVLTGIIEQRTPTFSGGAALSGRLAGVPGGTVTLVVNGSVVAGTVRLPGSTYRIRSAGGGRLAIIQVDPSLLPHGCETVSRRPGRDR